MEYGTFLRTQRGTVPSSFNGDRELYQVAEEGQPSLVWCGSGRGECWGMGLGES